MSPAATIDRFCYQLREFLYHNSSHFLHCMGASSLATVMPIQSTTQGSSELIGVVTTKQEERTYHTARSNSTLQINALEKEVQSTRISVGISTCFGAAKNRHHRRWVMNLKCTNAGNIIKVQAAGSLCLLPLLPAISPHPMWISRRVTSPLDEYLPLETANHPSEFVTTTFDVEQW